MKFTKLTSIFLLSSLLSQSTLHAQDIVLFGNVSGANNDGSLSPIHGAYVGIASSQDSEWYDITDEEGNYEFMFEWLWDGPVAVICEAEGYDTQTGTIMPDSDATELNFILSSNTENEDGILFGTVTYQVSPSGPVVPVSGASIGATPSWGPEPWFQTYTNEEGQYELELWASEHPWIVYCETEYGQQEAEAIVTSGHETELNFQFLGWEPDLPAPYNLTVELSNNGNNTILHWDYFDSPGIDYVSFQVYANLNDDPDNPWIVIGTTMYSEFVHNLPWPSGAAPPEICYRVTAVNDMVGESDPSEIACVDLDFSDLSPPYDLVAEYHPEGDGLYGGAELDWEYSNVNPTEPMFHIYLHYGYDDLEWMLVGESAETNYFHVFGDYMPPSNESCFKVTAVVNGEESEPSNIACVYLEETENGVVFGHVYEMSLDPNEVIPIPGAVLHFSNSVVGDTWTTVSGENGEYEISLPAGFYQTWIEAEGYEPQNDETVMVVANQEVEQNFYLQPLDEDDLVLHGFVRGQTDNSDQWTPLPGSHIRATPNDQEAPVYETETNQEGYYELPLPSGYYDVTASHEGYQTGFAYVYVGPNHENWQDFYLEHSDSQNAGLYGLVYWETPNGNEIFIPGAQIRAESQDANLVFEAETGEGGGYEMEVMEYHHYVVTCTAEFEGMELIQVHDIYIGESWAELNFGFGGEPPMDGLLTGYVFGIEIDAIFPLPSSIVSATPSGPTDPVWETTTDEEGQYELYLPPGEYLVTAQYEGYESVTVDVFIEPNQPNELDFYLEQEGYNPMIYGQVWMITANGNEIPVNEAFIQILNEETGITFDTVTDENGNFEIEVMPYMQYFVSCTIPNPSGTTQVQEVFVDISPVELIFIFGAEDFGWLVGYVHDSNPEPFPVSNANIMIENDLHSYETNTGESGNFEFHVPAGWYTIHVNASGFEPFSGEAMVYPWEESYIEIMLSHSEGNGTNVSFFGGWNLIGIPRQTGDTQIWDLFPESIEGTLYGYDQSGYYLETIPGNGKGYWLKFWEPGSASIYGEPFYEMTLELAAGWNLIAGPSGIVTYNGVIDPDEILVEGTLYRYTEGGYEMAEMIAPGNGYWIKTFDSGTITLHVTEDIAKFENRESLVSDANRININGQTLYFWKTLNEREMQSFSLPPAPPEGGVDVRFSGDTKLCSTDECLFEVMNNENQLTLECDIKDGSDWEIVDKHKNVIKCEGIQTLEFIDSHETFLLRKKPEFEISSDMSIISAFPNPFNPVTTIQFSVPELSNVSISIYDLEGRRVESFIRGKEMERGMHSVIWDASGFSSGIYIVHLNTNNSVQSQKIVLMK